MLVRSLPTVASHAAALQLGELLVSSVATDDEGSTSSALNYATAIGHEAFKTVETGPWIDRGLDMLNAIPSLATIRSWKAPSAIEESLINLRTKLALEPLVVGEVVTP